MRPSGHYQLQGQPGKIPGGGKVDPSGPWTNMWISRGGRSKQPAPGLMCIAAPGVGERQSKQRSKGEREVPVGGGRAIIQGITLRNK